MLDKQKTAGLCSSQLPALREKYGKNELVPVKRRSAAAALLGTLFEPMFLLLVSATAIFFLIGESALGIVCAALTVIVTANDFIQERRTDDALFELRSASAPTITARRDGAETVVPCSDLVPGDVFLLKAGDVVPADGIIIECGGLVVDESLFEDGSTQVKKSVSENGERCGLCFAGSVVLSGSAVVVAERTAQDTEYARLSKTADAGEPLRSPLQSQMTSLVKYTALAAAAMFLLVGTLTYFNLPLLSSSQRIFRSLLAGISLAVSAIPEEFPVILAVFLAMGALRLFKGKGSLARLLLAFENLGLVTRLCADEGVSFSDSERRKLGEAGITVTELSGSSADRAAAVSALRESGEVVAVVTGGGADGRAPLSAADVGIACNDNEANLQAADVTLEKYGFDELFETLRAGRRVYGNIRKAVSYVFAIHIPIVLAALFTPLLKIPHDCLLLLPVHKIMLELIIDPTCAVLYERLPAEDDVMSRPPRSRNEKVFPRASIVMSAVQGAAIFLASFGCYFYMLLRNGLIGESPELARSMGLLVFILANLFLFFTCASKRDSALRSFLKLMKDRTSLIAVLLPLALIAAAFYTPLSGILHLASPSVAQVLLCAAIAALSTLWYDLTKTKRGNNALSDD